MPSTPRNGTGGHPGRRPCSGRGQGPGFHQASEASSGRGPRGGPGSRPASRPGQGPRRRGRSAGPARPSRLSGGPTAPPRAGRQRQTAKQAAVWGQKAPAGCGRRKRAADRGPLPRITRERAELERLRGRAERRGRTDQAAAGRGHRRGRGRPPQRPDQGRAPAPGPRPRRHGPYLDDQARAHGRGRRSRARWPLGNTHAGGCHERHEDARPEEQVGPASGRGGHDRHQRRGAAPTGKVTLEHRQAALRRPRSRARPCRPRGSTGPSHEADAAVRLRGRVRAWLGKAGTATSRFANWPAMPRSAWTNPACASSRTTAAAWRPSPHGPSGPGQRPRSQAWRGRPW